MSNDRSQPDDVAAIDSLIERAGRTHVIPPREDQSLLDLLREPRVFRRATELLRSKNQEERHRAILCLERIGYVLEDQQTAEVLLQHADRTKDKLEVMTTLDALKNCTPPEPLAAEPLVRLARRPEWQVWHTAVQCLHLAPAGEWNTPSWRGSTATPTVSSTSHASSASCLRLNRSRLSKISSGARPSTCAASRWTRWASDSAPA